MEEWWEQAHARACQRATASFNMLAKYRICLNTAELEFGKRCPHSTSPSYGRAVADSQNFWRLEMRTLFCRSNRPSSGPCVAVFIYLYECRNCGKRYVGRTEQRLADRIDHTRSEAHYYGAGTREENTWSTTEGEKQPSGGVRLCDCLSSGCKQDMQSALRGW